MSQLLKILLLMAATSVAMDSNAALWNFSYTFGSGQSITGSFTGTANGDYVEDIGNIKVTFDGTAFIGTPILDIWGYNSDTDRFDPTIEAKVSSTLALNNFIILNNSEPGFPTLDVDNIFEITNDPTPPAGLAQPYVHAETGVEVPGGVEATDSPGLQARWSLTEVHAVPEPGSTALLGIALAGLALPGRRKAISH